MSRPTKYTPERVECILTALRGGNTRTASAAMSELDYSTFKEWVVSKPEFSASVIKAEADAESAMVARVRAAADDGTWTASAWWLERRRHKDWGKLERVEHSGPDGSAVKTEDVTLDDDQRVERLARLLNSARTRRTRSADGGA